MGKKTDGATKVVLVSDKPKSSEWRSARWGFLFAALAFGAIIIDSYLNRPPEYHRPDPEPVASAGLSIGSAILFIVIATLVVLALYGVARLFSSIQKHRAEAIAAEVSARLIPPADNGLFPWRVAANGDAYNLNAAPGAVVRANGMMPDPATADAREAVWRASAIQLAAGSRGHFLPQNAMQSPGSPAIPEVQMIEGERLTHVERLLLEAEGEEV